MKRKIGMFVLPFLLIVALSGCGGKTLQGEDADEILTTTPVDQEKTMITVRVEFGAGQSANLEAMLEEEFPDVDIVLRHDGSTDSVYTLRENLEAGVECDLILSRRLTTIGDIAGEYLYDLSAESFVNNYYMTAVDNCTDGDGNLYYLPGPMDVYGIVYDKTMFEEYGWEIPHSYTEFLALLDTIRETADGVVPLQVSMMYPDMFQILFNTYGYEEVYAGRDNYLWLDAYQHGEESMIGHMEPAAERFKELVEDGVFSVSDIEVSPSERSSMLYEDHTAAMIIECQNAVTYAQAYGADHEVAMMPFWTCDCENGDYLYGIPGYYMAINKSSAEGSAKKRELLLDIYNYLSSVEGQTLLIGDGIQISNVQGVETSTNDFSEEIVETIGKGQVINTFYFADGETNKQVERVMRQSAADMLSGTMSVEDWLLAADAARDEYLADSGSDVEVYGQSEETLTRLETAYTVAQMYAEETGADIGICRAGGYNASTNGYFYKGNITADTLACLTPDKESASDEEDPANGHIVTAKLTGQQILDVLNSAAQMDTAMGMNIYYVAYGLTVEFNPWADEGSRVLSCTLPDGTALDVAKTYSVAYFYGSLPDAQIETESIRGGSWQDNFINWLKGRDNLVTKPKMTLTLTYS